MNELTVIAFIKDGGQEKIKLPINFIADLSLGIKKKGSEMIYLFSGKSLEIVGLMIYSKQIGDRVITIDGAVKE